MYKNLYQSSKSPALHSWENERTDEKKQTRIRCAKPKVSCVNRWFFAAHRPLLIIRTEQRARASRRRAAKTTSGTSYAAGGTRPKIACGFHNVIGKALRGNVIFKSH